MNMTYNQQLLETIQSTIDAWIVKKNRLLEEMAEKEKEYE